jgi:hypothetical protein
MSKSRLTWLLSILCALVLGNLLYYLISGWGLITVHVKDVALKEVIRNIERQGHVSLVTNLDPELKISMYVTRVPLTDALETLAATSDSRWSLLYVVAPDKAKLSDGLSQVTAPAPADDWKRIFLPIPTFALLPADTQSAPLDPRVMHWRVEAPSTPDLQTYLLQGSKSADVSFLIPADWNPSMPQTPGSGTVESVVNNIASMTNSRTKEFFYLQGRNRDFRQQAGGNNGSGRGMGFFTDPDLMQRLDERIQQQIAALPADEQPDAKARYDANKAFFQSLAGLTPEERRQKMLEYFQNPDNQDRMDSRDSRRSPQQRATRMSRYVQNRATVRGH